MQYANTYTCIFAFRLDNLLKQMPSLKSNVLAILLNVP